MSNQYIGALQSILSNRYSVESAGMTTGDWVCANTKVKGRRFSFDGYQFQRAICDDLHHELDVIKISQVGLTEVQSRKALAFCIRNPGVTGIFSLPTEVMYRKFSQSRLKPMVAENAVFNPTTEGEVVRSMDLMQFGRSFLHVVAATEGAATSTPADFVFNDEVDLSDQKILALFSSRLQNSDYKIKQRFSTPSWVGFGIDSTYSVSDQREYLCKCSACNHWQTPLFNETFVYLPGLPTSMMLTDIDDDTLHKLKLEDAFVMCERCGGPLDLNASNREWVATYTTRTLGHGYRVRPFSSDKLGIAYIISEMLSYKRRDFIRGWYNTVIGEPHTDARARLDEAQIRACMGSARIPEISSGTPVFCGIDMGLVCHIVLGTAHAGTMRAFCFMTCPVDQLPDRLREIMAQYNLVSGTCDRYPYTPTANDTRDLTQGRIMPIEYRGSHELKPMLSVEGEVTHWQADRTKLLDNVARGIRHKTLAIEGYGLQSNVIITHLRDQIRQEDPEKAAVWVKLTGDDHYAHSLGFLLASARLVDIEANIGEHEIRSHFMIGSVSMKATAKTLL